MELISEIRQQINLINDVLTNLEQPLLLENQDFVLDQMTTERYFKIKYVSKDHINFIITLTPFGSQVDVDRAMEIYDVGIEFLTKNKAEYKTFFDTLLTSKVKVEYCGSNYTRISFFDGRGECVKTLKFVSGLYLRVGCKTKEYPPIYTR